jgi:hypothetical protein
MRITLAVILSLAASSAWGLCSPYTRQSFDAFMDCVDNETAAQQRFDNYREETSRRLNRFEREQSFRELCPDC